MMPTFSLTHLHYTQLGSTTWCATAQVSETLCLNFEALKTQASWLLNAHIPCVDFGTFKSLNWQHYASPIIISARKIAYNQRQLQRKGVRSLLQRLLDNLEINDTLDESEFPYRLIDSRYYVCFSHTGANNKDDISKNLNQGFNGQLNSNVSVMISDQRPVGIDIENSNIAWRVVQRYYSINEIAILESMPITQRDNIAKLLWQIKESFIKIHQYTLAQGLGKDYAYLVANLISSLKQRSDVMVIVDNQSHYHIAILPIQQTVVIF